MIRKCSLRGRVIGMAVMFLAGSAWAQQSTTVHAEMVEVPTGPGTVCSFKLFADPLPWSVSSCGLRVWYDNTQVLMSGSGYTNVTPGNGLGIAVGPETADTTTHPGDSNVYRNYVMDWSPELFDPVYDPLSTWSGDLLQVNFFTTPGYSGPASSILVYFDAQPGSDMIDSSLASINDTHNNTSTAFLCPATVSGFYIE